MTIKKKLIGYGYTDSNGVATLDYNENGTEISTLAPTGSSGYIGKGVGSVQLEAGLHSSEAVVSEPCNVLDCDFYDSGVSETPNSEWWKSATQSGTVSEDNTGLTLVCNITNDVYFSPNKKGTSKSTMDDLIEWNDFICEFTYISHENNARFMLRDSNGNYGMFYIQQPSLQEGDVFKAQYTNNELKCWRNGNPFTPYSGSGQLNGDVMIRFNIANGYLKIKDFKVYPI